MRKFNAECGKKHVIFATSSPVDEFYTEKAIDGKKDAVIHCNPLTVLLNQKRLDKLGQMGLDAWLAQFDLQKSSPIDKLRTQCSDEDLLATLKSRHLQAPAEILAWSRKMSCNLDDFNKEVSRVREQLIAGEQAKAQANVDPKTE